MDLRTRGHAGAPQPSHLVSAALAPLRATGDPAALSEAVCRLVTSMLATVCRIDLVGGRMPYDLVPSGGTAARSVRPGRPDLADPAEDGGEIAVAGKRIDADHARELSWVSVPLLAGRYRVGTLRMAMTGSSTPPPSVVSDIVDIAGSVATALVEAARRHEAVQVSLSLQETLLPHSLPRAPWFEVAARYLPATATLQVGGDWYDAQLVSSGELALSVGDVAGHGVEAAARMGELRTAMTALRMLCDSPHELIAMLHRLYDGSPTFATAICARLRPTGRFRWASAGHLQPLVARQGGGVRPTEGRSMPPLGAGAAGSPATNETRLRVGDTVVLYTDGLVERRDESLDVSVRRLTADVGSSPSLSPEQLLDHLVSVRRQAGPTGDDIAVVAARLLPRPPR